jgi:F0F1-type ATP synthase epsilon subunit
MSGPGQPVPAQLAIKAATRAVEGMQARVYVSGGMTRIEFTEETFTAWYAEECAQIRKDERAKVAEELEVALAREAEGSTWDNGFEYAIRVVRGTS